MKRSLLVVALLCVLGILGAVVPAAFRRAAARRAATASAALDAARAAAAGGDAATAIARYRDYFENAGSKPDPLALEGYAILLLDAASLPRARRDDMVAAFTAAEEALRQRPESTAVRARLGERKLAGGKHAEAREHLLVARAGVEEGDPAADAIDLALAKTWIGTGDVDRAEATLGRLVGFDADSRALTAGAEEESVAPAEAYVLLADHLRDKRDDSAAAAEVLERALRLHPDDPKVLLAYSRWKLASNDSAAAAEAAARAAELAPDSVVALLAEAKAKAAGADPAAALAAFAAVRERFPEDKSVFLAAADHQRRLRSSEGTLPMVEEGLARYAAEPRFVSFLVAMSIDSASLGRLVELVDAARERLGADSPAMVVLDARVARARREWAKAARLFEKARGLVPAGMKPRLDMELGECFETLGDHDLAMTAFQRNLKAGPIATFALAGVADAQLALGRTDRARATVDDLSGRVGAALESQEWGARTGRARTLGRVLRSMIAVEMLRPAAKRQWGAIETLAGELPSEGDATSWPKALVRAEVLVSSGDVAAAIAALEPSGDDAEVVPVLQARRLELITDAEGTVAAREAFEALPDRARRSPAVFRALMRAEHLGAVADDDAWLIRVADRAEEVLVSADAVDVLHSLAETSTAAGSFDTAGDLRRRAAKRSPDDFRAPLALALLAVRAADGPAAAAAAGEVVRIEGTDTPRARVARAASIVAAVRGGSKGNADTSGAWSKLSTEQADLLREAGKLLVEASNDRPGWQTAPALAVDVALLSNDLPAALDRLIEARECGPENAPLTRDLVAALVRAGRFAEADLLRVSVAPENLGGAVRTAIEEEVAAGRADSAAVLAERAIDVEDADAATLIWLGRLRARAGRGAESGELFRRATETDPANPEGWLWLARWEAASGTRDAAEATIARAVEDTPEGPARSLLAARGAVVLGKTDEAERLFDEAVSASGSDVGPAAHAVDFRLQRGQLKQAKEFLGALVRSISGDLSRTDLANWAVARLAGLNATPPRLVEGSR